MTYKRDANSLVANITDKPEINDKLIKDYGLKEIEFCSGSLAWDTAYAYYVKTDLPWKEPGIFVTTKTNKNGELILMISKYENDQDSCDTYEDMNQDVVHYLGLVDNDTAVPRINY